VIEIGPGKGALTDHLLKHTAHVVAIEIDPVLVQYLRSKYRDEARVEIVEADVLKADLAQWGRASVAGNLPYYITSPIVEKVLALREHIMQVLFLVQREVAERITAPPGSRDYGYLSITTQFYAQAETLFTIPPAAFRPPPKVDSAVIKLLPRAELPFDPPQPFLAFVARCFHQKRKTLRNNLIGFVPKEILDAFPVTGKRAEELAIKEMIDLFITLTNAR
jgi:16S rRNA (adenine1518-N6/adenine1519-N6)-dimethyltransferase